MTSRRCKGCHPGDSIVTHFLLGLALLSPTVILLTYRQSRTSPRYQSRVSREYLVNWQPLLNDSNVSLIFKEHRNPYRPLIFVPFRHSGGEFFSFAIKQTISVQQLGVKVLDVTKSGKATAKNTQKEEIQQILKNKSKEQLIFIESNVVNLDFKKFGKEPLLVSVIRDPFEVLLSCYHQKKYGNPLYRAFGTFTPSEFKDRLNNLTSSFEKCVLRNKHCTKHLLGSISMVKSFSGMPLPASAATKSDWSNKAMPQAKANIAAKNILVAVMEDFHFVPFVFERIAPKICHNLWYLFNMHQLPPWALTSVNISDTVKSIIKENDLDVLREHRFYNWVKARYERAKKFGFSEFVT